MDVKVAFDHVLKNQLLKQMIDLGINEDLVAWKKSFLSDWKIELVIDKHDNKEEEIEIGIPQKLPLLPIFFLIYISRLFDEVEENNSEVTFLLLEDLGFIAFGTLVTEIFQVLDIVASTVLHWGSINVIIYDTSKTEAMPFFRSHCQKLNKQLREADIKVGNKKIKFSKEAKQ